MLYNINELSKLTQREFETIPEGITRLLVEEAVEMMPPLKKEEARARLRKIDRRSEEIDILLKRSRRCKILVWSFNVIATALLLVIILMLLL